MFGYGMRYTSMTMHKGTLTRRILASYRRADDATRSAGADWYGTALLECEQLAHASGYPVERVACAMAHLSPRISWLQNVRNTRALVLGEPKPADCLAATWMRARSALVAPDPFGTFGKRASKTRAFARAILGDSSAVVVDVWAARVAGVTEQELRRVGGYERVADAYTRAATHAGITPREMQATTWVETRGRAT